MASRDDSGAPPPHVLVFPFPAQGHMIPLLELAHHLSAHGLSVTVLVIPGNLHLLHPLLSRAPAVRTLVLPLPPSPSLPAGAENTKDLRLDHVFSLMRSMGSLHGPIVQWARSTPSPPEVIVSDFFLGWTQHVAAELDIPRVAFCPSGALAVSLIQCLWREMPGRADPADDGFPVAFPGIPGSPVFPWRHLATSYRRYMEVGEAWEFVRRNHLDNTASWGYVFNTFADLEAPYLRHIRDDLGHPRVWAVGPLLPPGGCREHPASGMARSALAWLDGCPARSVVYVCFGSLAELTQRQKEALGAALERSGARFVWCVRESPAGGGAADDDAGPPGSGGVPDPLRVELGAGGGGCRGGAADMAHGCRPVHEREAAGGGGGRGGEGLRGRRRRARPGRAGEGGGRVGGRGELRGKGGDSVEKEGVGGGGGRRELLQRHGGVCGRHFPQEVPPLKE